MGVLPAIRLRVGGAALAATIVALAAASGAGAGGAIFTVTNTNDSGGGSLRDAITQANGTASPDRIEFAIGTGPHTIQLSSTPLPAISSPVTIDGTTQPGYAPLPATPVIEIKGDGSHDCLTVGPGGSKTTIVGVEVDTCDRGVVLQDLGRNVVEQSVFRLNNEGVEISGSARNKITGNVIGGNGFAGLVVTGAGSDRNVIAENRIGTNAAGTSDDGNTRGVVLEGGPTTIRGNLVSGNGSNGIEVDSPANLIIDNRIGTNAAGTGALGNGENGILLFTTGGLNRVGTPGHGNVISASTNNGVYVQAPDTIIQGNLIGTDITGGVALQNDGPGVFQAADNGLIGGVKPGAGNVISGNDSGGILILGDHEVIVGNLIGTTADGTAALGNNDDGIHLTSGSDETIGGAKKAARNVISGNNGDGIELDGTGVVQGNFIGTNAAGDTALANTATGVHIVGAPGSLIGGTRKGAGNLISGNGGTGVTVEGGVSAVGNQILGNSITANGGLGIDLGADGATPNDVGDGDTGANALQNWPLLTGSTAMGANTVVSGSLRSTANRSFRVELFAGAACDGSGFGEGARLVRVLFVTTNVTGDAPLTFVFKTLLGLGDYSGTATDLTTGDTSEFGTCL